MEHTENTTDNGHPAFWESQEGRYAEAPKDAPPEEPMNPNQSSGSGRYFEELVQEMRDLDAFRIGNPGKLRLVYGLLINEINFIWGIIFARASREGSLPLIKHAQQATRGRRIVMQEKVLIPERPNSKFIGRILGPRGLTVKQIEAQTNCRILVRGRGSVKDPHREECLRNRIGWEHLREPLHVLITASDYTRARCARKLAIGVNRIMALLSTDNDELKRQQLIQLAIINGTYRPTRM